MFSMFIINNFVLLFPILIFLTFDPSILACEIPRQLKTTLIETLSSTIKIHYPANRESKEKIDKNLPSSSILEWWNKA